MRIYIVHQYYKTPTTGGGIRSYYIAHYFKNMGHDVVVITARNNQAYSIDTEDGYEVHNLPVYYENHLGFLSRLHAFLRFVWMSLRLMKKLGKSDLNYVITTPLTTGFIARFAKSFYKTPYFFEVGDLWPEAPIQLGILKNPLLKYFGRQMELWSYRGAKHIIALSPSIADYIQKRCPEKPIDVITNFADVSLFEQQQPESTAGWTEKFVITYSGTVGVANHLEYMVDCAAHCDPNKFHFVILGDGARLDSVRQYAENKALTNISFLSSTNKAGVRDILSYSDAVYISYANAEVLETGSPNKFFDGLAVGKLIIVNFHGWIKDLVITENCGIYHNPLQPQHFEASVMKFFDPEALGTVQLNALKLAKRFSPDEQLEKLGEILPTAVED